VRAYIVDEAEHAQLRATLLEGDLTVVTSELTRLEFASAVSKAARAARIRQPRRFLDRFDKDCRPNGPISLLRFEASVLELGHTLIVQHDLGALDAIHLAVASITAAELAAPDPVVFVTRDRRQSRAAEALGLQVA
jgi:predicted nucleic acid-binding protein